MANGFSKQVTELWDEQILGFDDNCVLSQAVTRNTMNMQTSERSGDIWWRPVPEIMTSSNGQDQTGQFLDKFQLSVPSTLGYYKSVTWKLTGQQLRDPQAERNKIVAAFQKLASDVNVSVNLTAALNGTLVVKRTGAATGFDDVAQCDAILNETGALIGRRFLGVSTRDNNGMASNLAGRQTMAGRPDGAYGSAMIAGGIAGFEAILKMDYSQTLPAATATGVTINLANQYYTPVATTTAANGAQLNVDNRYQVIPVTVTAGTIKVGDCFTIAGVFNVHKITKQTQPGLKTFRVTALVTGAGGTGTIQISPPIISGQGGTQAELQYQNVSATPANGAALNFLNTVQAPANPFWVDGAIELTPGMTEYPEDAGWDRVMGTTPKNGMRLVMLKQGSIQSGTIFYRVDCSWGVNLLAEEQAGIILFNQT
jgi:hypothetical protein